MILLVELSTVHRVRFTRPHSDNSIEESSNAPLPTNWVKADFTLSSVSPVSTIKKPVRKRNTVTAMKAQDKHHGGVDVDIPVVHARIY